MTDQERIPYDKPEAATDDDSPNLVGELQAECDQYQTKLTEVWAEVESYRVTVQMLEGQLGMNGETIERLRTAMLETADHLEVGKPVATAIKYLRDECEK